MNAHLKPQHTGWLLLTVGIALLGSAAIAWGFAEEPLGWRDPATGTTYPTPPEISTVHDDLTYVLALAAGFSISDSKTLQTWDQLTDSELLPGAVVSYTNGGGSFSAPPNADAVCGLKPHSNVIWPVVSRMTVSTSVTSRYGVYSPFFHFPHQNERDLGALHDWAWGITDTLRGYEAYAWGGPTDQTVMQAKCLLTRTAVISAPMQAGSLEAFATYLHSLADSYSHLECIAAMDALGKPWATHTIVPPDSSVAACDYHPSMPQDDDVHGREFYTYTDSLRTDSAIHAIFGQLSARSLQREGRYYPLALNTPISGSLTLSDTLSVFVHQWPYDQPAERRNYADQLAINVLSVRQAMLRTYLPLTIR